jgi:hypothetical protein
VSRRRFQAIIAVPGVLAVVAALAGFSSDRTPATSGRLRFDISFGRSFVRRRSPAGCM